MESAENVLHYLLLCLSLLPYCWPVYTYLYRLQVLLQSFVLKIQLFFWVFFLSSLHLGDSVLWSFPSSQPADPGLVLCFSTVFFLPHERDLTFTLPSQDNMTSRAQHKSPVWLLWSNQKCPSMLHRTHSVDPGKWYFRPVLISFLLVMRFKEA